MTTNGSASIEIDNRALRDSNPALEPNQPLIVATEDQLGHQTRLVISWSWLASASPCNIHRPLARRNETC